jgi:hypothetical protein
MMCDELAVTTHDRGGSAKGIDALGLDWVFLSTRWKQALLGELL